jgi:hypothetical protein
MMAGGLLQTDAGDVRKPKRAWAFSIHALPCPGARQGSEYVQTQLL